LRLAFYVAFQKRRADEKYFDYIRRLWLDWLIACLSVGKYSHVEIVIGNKWFSVSPRTNSSQYRKIKPRPESWDYIDLNLSKDEECIVLDEIEKYMGMKYDYTGAITSVTPICIQAEHKVFCSEVCANIIRKTKTYSFLSKGCKYSPSALFNDIMKHVRKKNG